MNLWFTDMFEGRNNDNVKGFRNISVEALDSRISFARLTSSSFVVHIKYI